MESLQCNAQGNRWLIALAVLSTLPSSASDPTIGEHSPDFFLCALASNAVFKARIFGARALSRLVTVFCDHAPIRKAIVWIRSKPLIRRICEFLFGSQRTFNDLREAAEFAARYKTKGHLDNNVIVKHTNFADQVRESDYPALFFLAPNVSAFRHVFDFGGNVGNLFYAYQRHLKFSQDLVWTVLDLPEVRVYGETLAKSKKEHRIRFANSFQDASGADLLIVSGSMHYFERPIPEMLRELNEKPRSVLINRTPCSTGDDLITIQYSFPVVVPCKLHSRKKLIDGMIKLGYNLRAEWAIHELSIWMPLYPDWCNGHYSGFFFERE
jgi:putative methyltransferase (TIGR04325 family)